MRYWCISTSRDNWAICQEAEVWGMEARYYVTLERYVRAGDKALVYTHGGRFVAAVQFVRQHYYDETDMGWTKRDGKPCLFPYRMDFALLGETNNPPRISFSLDEAGNRAQWTRPNLIDDIVFIADKGRTWNQYLQVSIVNITEEDFRTVYKAITDSS